MYRSYRRILPLFYLIVCLNKLLVITSEQCIPVGQCSDEQINGLQLGRLNYEIAANSQNAVQVCPRSDIGIPQWEVQFTSGNFCSAVNFSSSIVCNNKGSLVFVDLTGFYNTSRSLLFSITVLNATLKVLYASTGVYPVSNPVFFEYNQELVDLMWFVYHPNPRPEIRIYHNGENISVDQTPVNISLYGAFIDETMCERSTSTEITVVYNLYIYNPNPTSAGEYILVADSFSVTITLIIDPSSIPNASTDIFSSSMTEPGFSQTPSVTTSNSGNDVILYSTVVTSLVLVALIIVVGVLVYSLLWKRMGAQNDQRDIVIYELGADHHDEQREGVHNPMFRQQRTVDHLDEISFNQEGLFYHLHDYGATIIIPEGAVEQPATLQFGASMIITGFKCEGPYEPVSPVIWVHINTILAKPAELYIPHYVVTDSIEDRMKLRLLTRGCEENDVFKVNNEPDIMIFQSFARISANHFCSVCLGSTPVPKKRYHLVYAMKELENGVHTFDAGVLYSYKCLKNFKSRYSGCEIDQLPVPFAFGELKINVQIPDNSGWEFKFRDGKFQYEYIKEEHVDFYQLLNCTPNDVSKEDIEALEAYEQMGSYPPCYRLSFIRIFFSGKSCEAKIFFSGQNVNVSIPIELQENPSSPTFSARLSSADSALSITSQNTKTPKDMLIINVMSFLESRLPSVDYFKFGYYLGLDMDQLHQIEENTGYDMKRCIRQVMLQWQKISPDPSCESIAEALKVSGYDLLSAIVSIRYGKSFCTICQKNHGPDSSDSDILLSHILNDSNHLLLKAEPEIAELSNLIAVKISSKWELFGTQLKVQQNTMNAFKIENHMNCQLCFLHLFNEWKRTRSCPFTWMTVIQVLCSPSLAEYVLAEDIYKYICRTKQQPPTVTHEDQRMLQSKQKEEETKHPSESVCTSSQSTASQLKETLTSDTSSETMQVPLPNNFPEKSSNDTKKLDEQGQKTAAKLLGLPGGSAAVPSIPPSRCRSKSTGEDAESSGTPTSSLNLAQIASLKKVHKDQAIKDAFTPSDPTIESVEPSDGQEGFVPPDQYGNNACCTLTTTDSETAPLIFFSFPKH